jgi:prevent-host-death family protein
MCYFSFMTTAKKKSKSPAIAKKVAPAKKAASIAEEEIEYQIGIRELRQDASRVIALVESGASITITKHGKPVATINPPKKSKLDILIERGAITPATKKIDLRTWRPKAGVAPQELMDAIRREREEERY